MPLPLWFIVAESFCGVGLLACVYMAIRNMLVYRYRVSIIETQYEKYDLLPDYDTMMLKFWVWPLSRFMPKDAQTKIKLVK